MTTVQPEQNQTVAPAEDKAVKRAQKVKKIAKPVSVVTMLITFAMFFGAATASPTAGLMFAFGFVLIAPLAFVSLLSYMVARIYLRRC